MIDPSAARILVVDDHAESRRVVEAAVALSGLRCVSASGADDAMTLCARERFACMLLDEVLGDDSGLALAARLHGLPTSRPARILMVSGLAPAFFEEALREGVIDGFIEKPVQLDELIAAVEAAVGARERAG